MHRLVNSIPNLLIPRLRRIYHDMDTKQHEELPGEPEHQIERQTIQQAMHQQVVPIFSFRLRDKINLEDIIPDQVAHHQSEHGFANFLAWHFLLLSCLLSYVFQYAFQYAEKLRKRELRIFLRIVFVKIQHIIYSLYI